MVWPHDTRLTTYAPAAPLKSSDLNAIQDAILLLLGERALITCRAVPELVTGAEAWVMDATNPERGWKCAGLGALYFHIEAPVSFELYALSIKYYNSHPSSARKPDVDLYLVNTEIGSDLAAPSLGSSLGDCSAGATIAVGAWGVRSIGLAGYVKVTAGRRLLFVINSGTTGDYVAAVNLVACPLTP